MRAHVVAGVLLLAGCGGSSAAPTPGAAVSPGLEYIQVMQTYDNKFTALVNTAGQTCSDHPLEATCISALETAASEGVAYQGAALSHPPTGCAARGGKVLSGAIDQGVAALAMFIAGEKSANATTIDAATARMATAETAYQAGRTQLSSDCGIP